MKSKHLKWLAVILAVLMLSAAFGCSGGEATSSGDMQSAAESTSSAEADSSNGDAASGEKVDLTFMTIFVETDAASDIATGAKYARINDFLADHPEVNFVNNSIPQTDYNTKIKAIIASDDLPDIWSIRGFAMGLAAIDADRLHTADDLLSKIDGWKESFSDGVFDDFLYKDQYWAIPVQLQGCSYLFLNMDIMKELGFEKAPATWDELVAAIKAAKDAGYVPLCTGNKDKYPIADCVASWINDRYCTSDWHISMREVKGARWTDQCFVDALKAFDELVQLDAFNEDANSLDQDQGQAYYANKQSPMFFSGAWGCEWIEGNCSEEIINATVCALPPEIPGTPGAQNGAAGGGGWGYCVTKSVEGAKLDTACELLYYLTDEGYTEASLERGYGRYPGKTPEGADTSKIGPISKQYLDSIPSTTWTPDYTVLTEPTTLEVYQNVYQELMVGTITPEEGAKKIDDAYQMYIDSMG